MFEEVVRDNGTVTLKAKVFAQKTVSQEILDGNPGKVRRLMLKAVAQRLISEIEYAYEEALAELEVEDAS